MGLLGNLLGGARHDAAVDGSWQPDGTGVTSGGDVGGDIQVGEDSYSVRYLRADMPGSMITITFYPVEYDECPGEYVVQRQTEWLVCEDPADPGGTEIWSEYEYDDLPTHDSDTIAGAEREAQEYAEAALGYASDHQWDGEPEWGGS
jgi:hypothetical protein